MLFAPFTHQPFGFCAKTPNRSHLLLMVAVFLLIGSISVSYVSGGVWLWGLAFIGAVLIVLLRKAGMRCGLGIAVLCFALGSLHAHQAFDVAAPPEGGYQITGSVYGGATMRSDNRLSFILGDIELDGERVPGKAYCSLHYEETPPELFDGAKLRFSGRVYHPDGKSGAPRFDFGLWMKQQGYSFGIAIYQELGFENDASSAPVRDAAYRVRRMFASAFDRSMGQNGRIAMALLLGERGGLTDEEYTAFQELGIAHIMSVSGLHVGLVGGLLMLALDRFRLKRRTKLIILIVFLADYCALTGFAASSIRAAVMLVIASLRRLFLRRGDRITTLSAAMIVVLVIDPLSALSAGFVLSFSAMLGIILCSRPLQEWLDKRWPPASVNIKLRTREALLARLQQQIKSLIVVSVSAQAGVFLPTMHYFQQLPLYGVLINLLIVPLVSSVLVPAYVLALFCSLFPFIGTAVGAGASLATDVLLWLVRLLSQLPHAVIRTSAPPVLVCVGLGLSMILLSRRVPGSFRRRALASALTAAVALGGWAMQRPADLRYIQLSVGQQDAALLLDGDTTIVIDAGADGEAVIDYLRYENRKVDALILTHLHIDHSGGAIALIESGIPIHQIYLPQNAHRQRLDADVMALYDRLLSANIPLSTLASGDELIYNRSMIRVLWPERETVRSGHDANDYPLVLSIDLDGYTLLNVSDLTGLYERYAAVPADILKVGHHGSKASTYDDFLDFVKPSYALISCTYSSRSLPHPDTLQRLSKHSIPVFRTAESGDITISVTDGQLTITPYKERTFP